MKTVKRKLKTGISVKEIFVHDAIILQVTGRNVSPDHYRDVNRPLSEFNF